jgi:hypothetical protein
MIRPVSVAVCFMSVLGLLFGVSATASADSVSCADAVVPIVAGDASVGSILTVSNVDRRTEPTIDWTSDGVPVDSSMSDSGPYGSYTIAASDVGHIIVATLVTMCPDGIVTTVSQPTTSVAAGTLGLSGLTIEVGDSGLRVRQQVSAIPNKYIRTFRIDATCTWYADGKAVHTTTGPFVCTYSPTKDVVGKHLSLTATYSADGYISVTQNASSTAPVVASTQVKFPSNATFLAIAGKAKVGAKLSIVRGSRLGGVKLGYQWLANGIAIDRATSKTFRVPASLKGKKIAVAVFGRDVIVTSKSTSTVRR